MRLPTRIRALVGLSTTCLLFLPEPAAAQITGGAIVGIVRDLGGGVLAGVTVTATRLGTNQDSVTSTNGEGYYELPLLPAGQYVLEASLTGFQRMRSETFELHSGTRRRFDLKLTLGSVSEAVDVVASAPLVNATTTALGVVMDHRKVESLPLNGRDFQQLVGLQAGVTDNR
jgi:hypothetical protein